MSSSHPNLTITETSQYINRLDPSSRRKLQAGDQVTICQKSSEAFLTGSLSASGNKCPFCQEVLSTVALPYVSASSQPQKLVIKQNPAPVYEENRRTNWGGLAAFGTGGVLLVILLCVVGAVIIFAINSGSTSGSPEPYPVSSSQQQFDPTSSPVIADIPTEEPIQDTVADAPSPELPTKDYAKISCSEISKVNLRRTPGYVGKGESDSLYEVPCGETVELLGPTKKADGLTWWKVSWNGYTGWIADHTGSGKLILDFST